MFRDFIAYKEAYPGSLKLVLMGKSIIEIPKHSDIISLGFVDDQDKFDGISGAKFLILPSIFESLSIVVLESFSLGVPVVVNGACEVLKSHCQRSNGGLYYKDTKEFCATVDYMIHHQDVCIAMGKNGQKYVNRYYQWDVVIRKLRGLIEDVVKSNRIEGK